MNPFLTRLSTEIPLLNEEFLLRMFAAEVDEQAAVHPQLVKMREGLRPQATIEDGVAIVPISGALMQNASFWEMAFGDVEDTGFVTDLVNQVAESPKIRAIVPILDTPGGMVTGGFELADAVAEAAKIKPVVAWTGSQAASLGYLIGSQATNFIATRSAQVGSIGTVVSIADFSGLYEKMGIKVHTYTNKEGDLKRLTPINDVRGEHLQGRADAAFHEFRKAVLAKRPGIPASAMRGQTFSGAEARAVGLVDSIGSLKDAVKLAIKLAS